MDNRSFNTRRRLFVWSPVLLASTAFVCTGLSLWMLYGSFRRQQEQFLTQQVNERLRLLETIGRSNNWDREKTLKEFVEFNVKHARLGATGECTLVCRDGAGLRFLFREHSDAVSRLPASPDTAIAEPCRKALEGNAGTLVGEDYRGIEVLAAYAPVPNWNWGIVVKIDASELRSPLLTTAVAAISVVMLLVVVGGLLIVQFGKPLIRELEQSNERLDLAIQGSSNGMWDWPDVTKDEQWWSPKLYELVGYATDEVTPSFSQFKAFLHPDDVDPLVGAVDGHLNQRIPHDIECRLRTKSGKYRWFRGRAKAIWDANGNPIRMSGSIEDIDKLKQAEEALRQSNDELQAIYDGMADGILIADAETRQFVRANASICLMLGYSEEELLSLSVVDIHPGKDLPAVLEAFQAQMEGDLRLAEDMPILRKDGRTFRADISTQRILYNGRPSLIGFFRDVTERKQAEAELRDAKQVAEAANQAKSEFLANISHEIRTPMTAILGFADILADTAVDKEAVEAIQIIRRNGENLLQIINDILDLSKIESNKCKIEQMVCSPRQVVTEAISLMKVRANAKGLSLVCEVQRDVPENITTDPIRLRQILVNLISNAIKFTELGGVQVVTQLVASGDEPKLRFDIIDTGIGLLEEQISRLFQPFSQADTSTNRQFGGTGLGLAISKRLANMLSGDIAVTSVLGKGSTFSLTIATGKLDKRPSGNHSPPSLQTAVPQSRLDGRILLAEDGPDNQRLIVHILRRAGAEVAVAENGQVAVDLALAAQQAGNPFDVVLMDIQMPLMDGFEATRRLRNAGCLTPIIALTAHAMAGYRQRCLDAGCNDYTTKPIDRAVLLECVAKYLVPEPVPT